MVLHETPQSTYMDASENRGCKMHSMHLGSDMSTDVSTDVSTVFLPLKMGGRHCLTVTCVGIVSKTVL